MSTVRRGDIYFADLSPVVGSEQGGMRPVLIVQNDTGNRHSRTIDKSRLRERMGKLPDAVMDRVNGAIAVSFGLGGGRPGGTIPQ